MLTIGTNGTKTFNIIPRQEATNVTVTLTSETTNTSYSDSTSISQDKYYYNMACDFSTTLKESSFYMLEVKDGNDIIFKDKVFCTDQIIKDLRWNSDLIWNLINQDWDKSPDGFSVNEGDYVEHSSNNEFIII